MCENIKKWSRIRGYKFAFTCTAVVNLLQWKI